MTATQYFTQDRDIELSTLFYLQNQLATDWPGTTIVKSFADAYAKDAVLPIVCVSLTETIPNRREVGSTTLEPQYLISVYLFCRSDGQRLDMASWLVTQLNTGWVHYQHSHMSGDKTQLDRVVDGRDQIIEFISNAKIDFGGQSDSKDRFRQNISFRVRKSS